MNSDIDSLEQEMEKVNREKEKIFQEMEELNTLLGDEKQKNSALRSQVDSLEDNLSSAGQGSNQQKKLIEQLESQIENVQAEL